MVDPGSVASGMPWGRWFVKGTLCCPLRVDRVYSTIDGVRHWSLDRYGLCHQV